MGRSKKNEFDDLSDDFKSAVLQSSPEEIRKRVSVIAILDCAMKAQLKDDPEVESARAALADLMEPYREDFKAFKLQIRFCKQVLDDKGLVTETNKNSGSRATSSSSA